MEEQATNRIGVAMEGIMRPASTSRLHWPESTLSATLLPPCRWPYMRPVVVTCLMAIKYINPNIFSHYQLYPSP